MQKTAPITKLQSAIEKLTGGQKQSALIIMQDGEALHDCGIDILIREKIVRRTA
ncbi:hypothetical protein [Candidatus Marimicrobium litorale]|uniref:hypothetical protein n=1 Tax=Candidatus Marimicrobium litorale TaxID=2518991 RepID=UPI002432DDCC|nr:hypothetical protein [Candidatus Marimicrobium litorale]